MGVGRGAGCERLTEQGQAQPTRLNISCSDDPIAAASLTTSRHHPIQRILIRDPCTMPASSAPLRLPLWAQSQQPPFSSKLPLPQGLCTSCLRCLDTSTHTSLPYSSFSSESKWNSLREAFSKATP